MARSPQKRLDFRPKASIGDAIGRGAPSPRDPIAPSALADPGARPKGAILVKVGDKLVKLGLVQEVRAKAGMPIWRREDSGQSCALKLTADGLKAIAANDGSEETIATSKAMRPEPQPDPDARNAGCPVIIVEPAKALMPRAGSKLARVIDLLQRPEGATILQLMAATEWLPHTTRAALSGLRKRGYAVSRGRSGE